MKFQKEKKQRKQKRGYLSNIIKFVRTEKWFFRIQEPVEHPQVKWKDP